MSQSIPETKAYALSTAEYKELADKILVKSDTFVLNGHRCGLKVMDNVLFIHPGSVMGEDHDPIVCYRGTTTIRKIVVTSSSGYISVDALRWCREQDISLLFLDGKGNLVFSCAPESRDSAELRRLQYAASGTEKGSRIALELVKRKTISQYDTVSRHPELKKRDELLRTLEQAEWELEYPDDKFLNIDYLRLFEGRLSVAYFNALVGLPLQWTTSGARKVPPHWRKVTGRISPISVSGNARFAVCPFHAGLNYMYTIEEHNVLCAIHTLGLDPACGFLHADRPNRDSLVYDLIEPLRAKIDDKVLGFFSKITMKKGDLDILSTGQVVLSAEFARYLMASCRIPSENAIVEVDWFKGAIIS